MSSLLSGEKGFKDYRTQMKSWFLMKEYPENLLETAKGTKGVPFKVAYQPLLKNLGRIMSENFLSLFVNVETVRINHNATDVVFQEPL